MKKTKKEVKKDFPLFIRKTYVHKGIEIYCQIDYIKQTISLVEKDGTQKKWFFNDRGTAYMQGWRNILEAMDYAIVEAKAELEEYEKQKQEELLEFAVEMAKLNDND